MTQGARTSPVHGRPRCCFHGFQIEPARSAEFREGDTKQLIYLVGDFLLDCFRRFFPAA